MTEYDSDYILYSLLHLTHLTFTPSESRRSNFFEPQFEQIGHALAGFINNIFVNYIWILGHDLCKNMDKDNFNNHKLSD